MPNGTGMVARIILLVTGKIRTIKIKKPSPCRAWYPTLHISQFHKSFVATGWWLGSLILNYK